MMRRKIFRRAKIVATIGPASREPEMLEALLRAGMDPWQKESLNLKVGDTIIWQDEAIEVEGQPAVVTPGMRGEVISLHDGFHLDVAEVAPIPPTARVQFDSGMALMVDERMKWEKAD